jgi:hypothetical protein
MYVKDGVKFVLQQAFALWGPSDIDNTQILHCFDIETLIYIHIYPLSY